MESKKIVRIAGIVFILVLILVGIVKYIDKNKKLQNAVIVTAKVQYTIMGRGGLSVYVEYYYQGKKYDDEFLATQQDNIGKGDNLVLRLSKEPLGEYIEYIRKADKW
jgi:hypothetical protein